MEGESSGLRTTGRTSLGEAPDTPPLRLINEDGELLCEDCQTWRKKYEEEFWRRTDAEKELAAHRRRIAGLEADKVRERNTYVRRAEIEMAFDHWKKLMVLAGWSHRNNCKMNKARFDSIRSALEDGYTVVTIDHASFYISRYPWPTKTGRVNHGRPEDRRDDIKMICEQGDRLENWAWLGARLKRQEGFKFPWGETKAPPIRVNPDAPPLFVVPEDVV